tara:strand:+ start:43 stop:288 length:246 start_codon:yes stop_codon:yes gene_type:complete
MGFAFDTPTNPYSAMSQSDIDTWWASKDRTVEHGWDDAHGYIMRDIGSSIPAGHTIKHGLNDEGKKYYLAISGPNINKTWT